jgi:hypothetical protein
MSKKEDLQNFIRQIEKDIELDPKQKEKALAHFRKILSEMK